jgi:hypothetical protein
LLYKIVCISKKKIPDAYIENASELCEWGTWPFILKFCKQHKEDASPHIFLFKHFLLQLFSTRSFNQVNLFCTNSPWPIFCWTASSSSLTQVLNTFWYTATFQLPTYYVQLMFCAGWYRPEAQYKCRHCDRICWRSRHGPHHDCRTRFVQLFYSKFQELTSNVFSN